MAVVGTPCCTHVSNTIIQCIKMLSIWLFVNQECLSFTIVHYSLVSIILRWHSCCLHSSVWIHSSKKIIFLNTALQCCHDNDWKALLPLCQVTVLKILSCSKGLPIKAYTPLIYTMICQKGECFGEAFYLI